MNSYVASLQLSQTEETWELGERGALGLKVILTETLFPADLTKSSTGDISYANL